MTRTLVLGPLRRSLTLLAQPKTGHVGDEALEEADADGIVHALAVSGRLAGGTNAVDGAWEGQALADGGT